MFAGRNMTFAKSGAVDPLAGLTFAFRGYGLPTGAFQDSALTTPATADADPLGGWRDTNAVAFVQATSGQRPSLENISGATWAARFDGTDDFLARSNITLAGDFTVFVRQATTGDCCLVGSNGSNNQILRIGNGGINRLSIYDGSADYVSSNLSVSRGVDNIVGIIRSGSTITFYEGAATRGTGTTSASITAGVIGAVTIGAAQYIKTTGDIYAVLIATSDMTANVTQIVDALNAL